MIGRLLAGCVALCMSGIVGATDWSVSARTGEYVSRSASGVRSNVTFSAKARVPTAPVVYTNRPVVYARATAARLLRFGLSPAGALTSVALYAFSNYLIDEGYSSDAAGNWNDGTSVPAQAGSPPQTVANTYCKIYSSSVHYGWSRSQCYAAFLADGALYPNCQIVTAPFNGGVQWYYTGGGCPGLQAQFRYLNASNQTIAVPSFASYTSARNDPNAQFPSALAPNFPSENVVPNNLTDEQLQQKFDASPHADSRAVNEDIFEDAQGVPWSTPEIEAARQQLRDELATQSGTDPATLPAVDPPTSYDPSNPLAPQVQAPGFDSTPTGGGASAEATAEPLPAACEWWEIACQWLEWTKEPVIAPTDDPDLPTEAAAPGSWSSGIGGGSCPAPMVISVLSASVPISWQPACDFVLLLRPLLLGIASVTAALILLGQRSGGTA